MQIASKNLDDGSLEFVVTLSTQEADEYKRLNEVALAIPLCNIPNPFERTAKYCVICSNTGRRETIEAYGDIHAFTLAFSTCGGPFGLTSGACRE